MSGCGSMPRPRCSRLPTAVPDRLHRHCSMNAGLPLPPLAMISKKSPSRVRPSDSPLKNRPCSWSKTRQPFSRSLLEPVNSHSSKTRIRDYATLLGVSARVSVLCPCTCRCANHPRINPDTLESGRGHVHNLQRDLIRTQPKHLNLCLAV